MGIESFIIAPVISPFDMKHSKTSAIAYLFIFVAFLIPLTGNNYIDAQQNQSAPNPCITIENNKTSVAGPSPSPNVIGSISNESAQGFSNLTDVEKATGSNKEIFANNTDIDSDISTTQGMEKSQLGNALPGQQGTILEGGILQNLTKDC